MELSKQVYVSGMPCPSLGELPDPETDPGSPALQSDSLPSEPPGKLISYAPIKEKKCKKDWLWIFTNTKPLHFYSILCFLGQILYHFILCIFKLIFVILVNFTTFIF